VLALFVVLTSGAGLRYWLSTAIPFDASEFAALADAGTRNHTLRIPFIMFTGLGLLALYVLARRAAGVPAAFVVLLALQTSLTFQEYALRIRWSAFALPFALGALAYWRHTRPSWRPPPAAARGVLIVALLLGVRGLYLGVTLPERLDSIRRAAVADPDALLASVVACGGGSVTPLEQLRGCALAWPDRRSLAQQEALLEHSQHLAEAAVYFEDSGTLPSPADPHVAVFDPAAVAFFITAEGPAVDTALRVLRLRTEAAVGR